MYLIAGVTTLRDLGGEPAKTAALARTALDNPNKYPTIFPGSWFIESYAITHPGPWSRLVRTEEEIDDTVSEAKRQGAVTVKVYGQLRPLLAQRLIVAARRAGLMTACHSVGYSAVMCSDNGVDSIEHTSCILECCLPPAARKLGSDKILASNAGQNLVWAGRFHNQARSQAEGTRLTGLSEASLPNGSRH
jgi:hypothetical protein